MPPDGVSQPHAPHAAHSTGPTASCGVVEWCGQQAPAEVCEGDALTLFHPTHTAKQGVTFFERALKFVATVSSFLCKMAAKTVALQGKLVPSAERRGAGVWTSGL